MEQEIIRVSISVVLTVLMYYYYYKEPDRLYMFIVLSFSVLIGYYIMTNTLMVEMFYYGMFFVFNQVILFLIVAITHRDIKKDQKR